MAEKKNRYEVVQIPTQTEIVFRDTEIENEQESILQEKELLCRMANDVAEVKNALVK
jgi:hypothetical protein